MNHTFGKIVSFPVCGKLANRFSPYSLSYVFVYILNTITLDTDNFAFI